MLGIIEEPEPPRLRGKLVPVRPPEKKPEEFPALGGDIAVIEDLK
jgi:hypothetical protein